MRSPSRLWGYGALLMVALFLLAPEAETKWSVYNRPVSDVAWAIGLSQKTMSKAVRRAYAKVVLREGRKRKFDSFTLVAIIHNESKWNATVVGGRHNKCHGLGQHCVQFKYKYCMGDKYESAQCKAKRQWLLNGYNNIAETSSDITEWRAYIRKKTGKSALFARWLQCYQGYNRPKSGLICGMRKIKGRWRTVQTPKQTRDVMNYRKKLIRENKRRRR